MTEELVQIESRLGPFYVRRGNGRSDEYTLDENSYRHMTLERGWTVLDLGAHIGTFARDAVRRGCAVVAVEAEERNYEVLWRNIEGYPIRAIHAAVTSDGSEHTDFYVNDGRCNTRHTVQPVRGRRKTQVPSVNLGELLSFYRPQAMKCDIEGGEFELDLTLPDHVVSVAMELHHDAKGIPYAVSLAAVERILETMELSGFRLTRPVNIRRGGRLPVALWTR